MGYSSVLLDVGGTLWVPNSVAFDPRVEHLASLTRRYGLLRAETIESMVSARLDRDDNRVDTRAVLAEALLQHGLPTNDGAVEELRRCFVHDPRGRRRLVPGAGRFLRNCRARGIRVALVANAFARTGAEYIRDLSALGLDPDAVRAIDASVSSADCGWRKPSSLPLHRAMHQIDARRDSTVMVGDNMTVDGGAARESAVDFVLIDGYSTNLAEELGPRIYGSGDNTARNDRAEDG